MEQFSAQEQAVFRGVAKGLLLGIAVVVALISSCYGYFSLESMKAKANDDYAQKAAAKRAETEKMFRALD